MHFVAIAPNQWDGQWMNRQHLMWAVKHHAPVLYAQEPEPWYAGRNPRDERMFRASVERKSDTLSVLRLPKCLCRRGRQGVWNATVDRWKAKLIRREVRSGDRPRVFYFWHPELYPYAELLQPDLVIYHVYDRMAEYHEARFAALPIQKDFREACKLADIVVVGTREQAEIVPRGDAQIVPNGVAYEWYDRNLSEPNDMAHIPRPRIGYAGAITQKLDFAWFESFASHGQFHLVLVGPLGNLGADGADDWNRLCSLSNVHYLGAKPASDLPAYIKSFDVGLVNYRRGIHSEAASPLKLFEYAAAGLPIVAARTQAMSNEPTLAEFVHLVDGPDEAVAAVEHSLQSERGEEIVRRRKEFARENSWQQRARRIVDLAVEKLNRQSSIALPSSQGEQTVRPSVPSHAHAVEAEKAGSP